MSKSAPFARARVILGKLRVLRAGSGYCPEGFHCGTPQCRCTRQGRGGCRETTCEEVTGRGNYNPVCFPNEVEEGPCDEDSDCPLGDACVDYECREDPFSVQPVRRVSGTATVDPVTGARLSMAAMFA